MFVNKIMDGFKLIEIEHGKFRFKVVKSLAQSIENELNSIHTSALMLDYKVEVHGQQSLGFFGLIVIHRGNEPSIFIKMDKSNKGRLKGIEIHLGTEERVYKSSHINYNTHVKALQKVKEIM